MLDCFLPVSTALNWIGFIMFDLFANLSIFKVGIKLLITLIQTATASFHFQFIIY